MAASMVEEYTFKVEYLGSLMLGKAPTGLGVIQKPLRELYLNNIRKNDNKIRAQERVLKIRPEGILMTYKDSSGGQNKHGFYEMSSIHFKDAVTFVIRKGNDKKLRGVFEPLAERRKGTADSFFTMLDKKYAYLADKKHPGLFVCIMRRPLGVKALDCHVFIMANHKETLQIVDIIEQLQVNVENVIPENPKSPSAGPGSILEAANVSAYRPTEHPSQQTSAQRYELRDDFFRPQAYYDQFTGESRDYRDSDDIRANISNNSRTTEGVAMFHNTVDDFGRPTQIGNESEVRMRHPVNRNSLNTSFDDRKHLNVNASFEEQRRRPNPNLSFDESRRPFSMFQEGSRRDEETPNGPGQGQRFSSDDAVLNNRFNGGNMYHDERSPSKMLPKQQNPQYQHQQQYYHHQQQQQHQPQSPQKPLESPSGDASVQELTAAFERENRKVKHPIPPPGHRSLSPTPRTAAKPDRNSRPLSPTSPGGQPKAPSPSPGWGQPMASMSNLESRQEMEKGGKRIGEPVEPIVEESPKTRPVAKVPPHLVAGVKVLPTEFKVPLRKISPQASPRCEDPDRYNKLSSHSHNRYDYQQKNNSDRHDFQKSSNNYNIHNNYNDQSGQNNYRNSGGQGNYREQSYQDYSHGGQPIGYNKMTQDSPSSKYNRYDSSQEWGHRERPPYGGPVHKNEGVRDPVTGEIDKPNGSLKDKEIASMVSNIYIGDQPHIGRNTNFEQSLGYYP